MSRVDIAKAERITADRIRRRDRWKWDPPEDQQTEEMVEAWWEAGVRQRVEAQEAERRAK